jgi:hypothetical protein
VKIRQKLKRMLEIGNSGRAIVAMARAVGIKDGDEATVETSFIPT